MGRAGGLDVQLTPSGEVRTTPLLPTASQSPPPNVVAERVADWERMVEMDHESWARRPVMTPASSVQGNENTEKTEKRRLQTGG